ncbi:hypothetical protein WA577_004959, partial [Blastocystis sp. JDR]
RGFGKVYEGSCTSDGSSVAIKVVLNQKGLSFLEEEANVLKSVNSDFVVKYRDVINQPEGQWLIMEYCSKGSLGSYLRKKGKLIEAVIRDIAACCLLGLNDLHKENIMHRDFKPDNLLFADNGIIKLSDFGFSQILNSPDSIRPTFCGTIIYMAPETFDRHTCLKSDIYSFGITLIELAQGKNPNS